MKSWIATISLLLSFLLAGCSGTSESRATGRVIDDASITARVKTEIAQTAGVGKAASINVDTYRGVVSLAGFVSDREQAQMAVQAARRVAGVTEVKNNLEIKPKQ